MDAIPFIDIRGGNPSDITAHHRTRALSLLAQSRKSFGPLAALLSYPAYPLGDRLARGWMLRAENPYLPEIEASARILGAHGVYALNIATEWGCTSGVFETPEGPALLRVLDWPFPGLGEHLVAAHQSSEAGEYYNLTWPGMSGVIQASAPGRFACAINQAPIRRQGYSRPLDWLANRRAIYKSRALPPTHLLRYVFDRARGYEAAKKLLSETPVSSPVIFTLAGARRGEGCVIERLENDAIVHDMGGKDRVVTANHFRSAFNGESCGWQSRPIDSRGRFTCMAQMDALLARRTDFSWFTPPLANLFSRVLFRAVPAQGSFEAQGVHGGQTVTELYRCMESR